MSSAGAEALAPTQTEFGSSRVAELQRCGIAHDLRYGRGILPRRDAVYFDVGRYVHASLRYVNDGVIAGEARDWRKLIEEARRLREVEVAAGRAQAPAWDETDPLDEAERLVGAYYALHGSENGGWPAQVKLLHTEHLLSDPSIQATCRADLVVELDGELIIPDTKTRSRKLPEDREDAKRAFRTHEQFLRLSALAQKHFELAEPPPIWIDAIIKTKIPAVDRLLVRFTQSDIDAWRENQIGLLQVQHALRHLPVVRNYHECAPPIGEKCWAFKWCHGSDAERAKYFRVREDVK